MWSYDGHGVQKIISALEVFLEISLIHWPLGYVVYEHMLRIKFMSTSSEIAAEHIR